MLSLVAILILSEAVFACSASRMVEYADMMLNDDAHNYYETARQTVTTVYRTEIENENWTEDSIHVAAGTLIYEAMGSGVMIDGVYRIMDLESIAAATASLNDRTVYLHWYDPSLGGLYDHHYSANEHVLLHGREFAGGPDTTPTEEEEPEVAPAWDDHAG
jgi:hypothetical protein